MALSGPSKDCGNRKGAPKGALSYPDIPDSWAATVQVHGSQRLLHEAGTRGGSWLGRSGFRFRWTLDGFRGARG